MGWLGWVVLMLLGLVFVVSLLFWLAVMVLYSLVAGWITGARPPSPCCGSATAPWPASTGRGARRARGHRPRRVPMPRRPLARRWKRACRTWAGAKCKAAKRRRQGLITPPSAPKWRS
jgi:hypothetical protein